MDIAKIFKKMLSSSNTNKEQILTDLKILDFKVVSYTNNRLYWWRLPNCELTFIAKNGQTYTACSNFGEFEPFLTINIKDLDDVHNRVIARIDNSTTDSFELRYDRIDVQENLRKSGIGYTLQDMMIKICFLVAEENNVIFKRIHGIIGTDADDDPESSMKLYKKFDNKTYNNHKLALNWNGFNAKECNLEYFIS